MQKIKHQPESIIVKASYQMKISYSKQVKTMQWSKNFEQVREIGINNRKGHIKFQVWKLWQMH